MILESAYICKSYLFFPQNTKHIDITTAVTLSKLLMCPESVSSSIRWDNNSLVLVSYNLERLL